MKRLDKCIHFYIGCNTNKGRLIGIKNQVLFIQNSEGHVMELDLSVLGSSLFLFLQPLKDLSDDQSKELINKGVTIGRPNGYTFSNEGFLYLISLDIDLFGLINSGYAKVESEDIG
jgi:hypothetical protein